jgi:SAM-dependent methyltransferase
MRSIDVRGTLRNLGLRLLSPEVRAVARIIRHPDPHRTQVQAECDSVFTERLRRNTSALRMRFWEDHFEWKDLLGLYPEIDGHMLDFGCGSGHSDVLLARRGRRVYGVDLSPIAIRIAEYYRAREPARVQENLEFEVRDITTPNDLGIRFDSAWSSHVFEHIAEPGPVLRGLEQYLEPGAPLLISVPFRHAYDDPGHVNHFYSPDDLRRFLDPHITVERVDLREEHQVLRALCRNE